jgi:hypothetical protein
VAFDASVRQAARDDPDRPAVLDDDVEQFGTRVQPHLPGVHLAAQRAVAAQQELLAGLAAGVEGARDLGTAEGTVVEIAGVIARERDALRNTVIDDLVADLGQAVDVRLARAVVAPLDGVAEQALDAVAVVTVVLGRVDPALRGDGVRPPRAVVEGEALDPVTELGEARRRRSPGKTRADDDDSVPPFVRRTDQPDLGTVALPLVGQGAVGDSRFEVRDVHVRHLRQPRRRAPAAESPRSRRR